jgi:predicted nucleic acid-binding protein
MGQVIGLDTSIFIYLLEENKQYLKRVEGILSRIEEGNASGVFSSIGIIELLTGPKKKNRYDLAAQYRELIAHFPNLTIVGLTEPIIEQASELRARYGIKTPDAIHLATAITFGADYFITNDKKLKRVKEIPIKLL